MGIFKTETDGVSRGLQRRYAGSAERHYELVLPGGRAPVALSMVPRAWSCVPATDFDHPVGFPHPGALCPSASLLDRLTEAN